MKIKFSEEQIHFIKEMTVHICWKQYQKGYSLGARKYGTAMLIIGFVIGYLIK